MTLNKTTLLGLVYAFLLCNLCHDNNRHKINICRLYEGRKERKRGREDNGERKGFTDTETNTEFYYYYFLLSFLSSFFRI